MLLSCVFMSNVVLPESYSLQGPSRGDRELYPGTGVFISNADLLVLVNRANHNGRKLTHLLFDFFHQEIDLTNYTAFTSKGARDGKMQLNKKVLDAIESMYLIHCVVQFLGIVYYILL